MSSSPSTPQAVTWPVSSKSSLVYRQVDYYDGASIRIVESRRRRQVMGPEASTMSSRHCPPAAKAAQALSRPSSPIIQASDVRPTSPSIKRGNPSHVTCKPRRSKDKVAIVQASTAATGDALHTVPHSHVAAMSTPPPTPKMGRLPTPELDELPERPFCDCCIEAHVVKYCASCGHEMHRLKI